MHLIKCKWKCHFPQRAMTKKQQQDPGHSTLTKILPIKYSFWRYFWIWNWHLQKACDQGVKDHVDIIWNSGEPAYQPDPISRYLTIWTRLFIQLVQISTYLQNWNSNKNKTTNHIEKFTQEIVCSTGIFACSLW